MDVVGGKIKSYRFGERGIMKSKSMRVFTSLVALSVSVGNLPAFADKAAVEQAEKRFNDFVKQVGKSNPQYPVFLANLADTYIRNGMQSEADDTFKKAVESQKTKDTPTNSKLPAMYAAYATTLLSLSTETSFPEKTRKNFREHAEKLLQEGQPYADKCAADSIEKLNYGLRAIQGYRMAGMKPEEVSRTAAYDKELKVLEDNDKLGRDGILTVAMMLLRMGQMYAPSPAFRAARMMGEMKIIPDNSPTKPGTVKQKDYKAAETYHLRAMAQYNRLPDGDPTRIDAQRNLAFWFQLYGQKQQADYQTKQLSKLLHTTERDKLFPPAPPCPACGMG